MPVMTLPLSRKWMPGERRCFQPSSLWFREQQSCPRNITGKRSLSKEHQNFSLDDLSSFLLKKKWMYKEEPRVLKRQLKRQPKIWLRIRSTGFLGCGHLSAQQLSSLAGSRYSSGYIQIQLTFIKCLLHARYQTQNFLKTSLNASKSEKAASPHFFQTGKQEQSNDCLGFIVHPVVSKLSAVSTEPAALSLGSRKACM